MANEIRVPRLGWSMETGVFVRWLKADGDPVKVGDALYELEGEKATQEIEAVDAGVLRIPADAPAPGTEVAVGALLGYVTAVDEVLPARAASQKPKAVAEPAGQSSLAAKAPVAGPAARRLARELGVELQAVAGNGGRVRSADVRSAVKLSPPRETIATPRARRLAKELGVDWKSLNGSGRNGRVREQDVRAATPGANASGSAGMSPRRRTIAQRMLASSQQTAAVTLTTRAEATNLVSLRNQFKTTGSALVPTFTDIVAKLAAIALAQHPALVGGAPRELHIGIAVDTEAGLLVPVVRNVAELTLPQLAARSLELVELARRGTLQLADMTGGVFTITNLGNYGIDAFTPIINLPETAILGLGAIRREAVVLEDDRIVARDQITLSLTFDHCLVDGAPAARFLQTIVAAIENPSAWLLQSG
jgi:pyruvate dehydrogenase E2 component (dihydrolipoamide acetyltransferase)